LSKFSNQFELKEMKRRQEAEENERLKIQMEAGETFLEWCENLDDA
jgi:hypothetical protein